MSGNGAQWSILYEEFRACISLLFHVVSCGKNKKGGLICSPLCSDKRRELRRLVWNSDSEQEGERFLSKETLKGIKGELWYTRTGYLSQWAVQSHQWEPAEGT